MSVAQSVPGNLLGAERSGQSRLSLTCKSAGPRQLLCRASHESFGSIGPVFFLDKDNPDG